MAEDIEDKLSEIYNFRIEVYKFYDQIFEIILLPEVGRRSFKYLYQKTNDF